MDTKFDDAGFVRRSRRRVAWAVVPRWRALGRARADGLGVAVAGACRAAYPWATRLALAVVYLWFGLVKLLGKSQASPLALALTAKTIGAEHFHTSFVVLAWIECAIGVLVMVPAARRVALPAILVHMGVVCAPLVLVPEHAWQSFLVPTLEGQYIIKNVLVISSILALGAVADRAVAPVAPLPVEPRRRVSLADRLALGVAVVGVTMAAIALWTTVHQAPRSASASAVRPVVAAAPTTVAPVVTSTVAPTFVPVTMTYSHGALTMAGTVASDDVAQRLEVELGELLPVETITDELTAVEGAGEPDVAVAIPADEVFDGDSAVIRLDFARAIVKMAAETRNTAGSIIDVTVPAGSDAAGRMAAIHDILVAQGVDDAALTVSAADEPVLRVVVTGLV